MNQIQQLVEQQVPLSRACHAFGLPRSSYYHAQRPQERPTAVRTQAGRSLSEAEQETVLALLHSEPFVDQSPRQIYATLLDEGDYYCSVSTMYRLLRQNEEVKERRNQRQHPSYSKPELLAEQPNELWSWDITKLKSNQKWVYFYLYVILDVFSPYVVGWMIAEQESADLAQQLIRACCHKQQVAPDQLTLHADRGSPMIAKTTAQLLSDLGVAKTHSRPYTSNDNPFSEAQFKTMKYRPDFPDRFGSVQDARAWARNFFAWYNHQHHHTGLVLLTPAVVHAGRSSEVIDQRQVILEAAYLRHPERFVHGQPLHPPLPTAVWINPPSPNVQESELLQ